MNVTLRLALLGSLMLAASVVRCGGTTQSGSESHFLGECAASSECEQGLECECGVCTRSCAADAECEDLSAAARCVQSAGCESRICGVAADVVDAGAPQTDGNVSQADGADVETAQAVCGNGTVEAGEQCDEQSPGCGSDCLWVCSDDAACSDFIFCNGAEVCGSDHACQAGAPLADGTFCGQDRICQAGDCVVAPSPTQWTTCTDEACLCDGLAACAPVERQVALPLGSMGSRVCGVQADRCIVSAYDETEGGVTVLRCEVPLGDSCDDGVTLAAGSPYCESVLSCNVLMQSCPADLLACPSVAPPTCSAVDPVAFGDCTLSLGYAFDGTGCVSVSGCGCDPSCDSFFATRDECWTGCSRSCTDVVAARQDFYEQNDHCTTDADCMWVESGGPPYEHCSCMVAVNRNIDIGVWRALNFSYGCFEQGTCCDADPPPTPTCNAGRCVAGSG